MPSAFIEIPSFHTHDNPVRQVLYHISFVRMTLTFRKGSITCPKSYMGSQAVSQYKYGPSDSESSLLSTIQEPHTLGM